MCAAPTALMRLGFAYPALTRWANLCRTSGAKEKDEIARKRGTGAKARFACACVSRRLKAPLPRLEVGGFHLPQRRDSSLAKGARRCGGGPLFRLAFTGR